MPDGVGKQTGRSARRVFIKVNSTAGETAAQTGNGSRNAYTGFTGVGIRLPAKGGFRLAQLIVVLRALQGRFPHKRKRRLQTLTRTDQTLYA